MISLILIFIYSSGAASQDLATIRAPDTCGTQYSKHIHSLRKRQALLNLSNRLRRVQTLRTRPAAVQDGVAPVQAHAVVELIQPLTGRFIARVGDPAVGLEEDGRAEVLLAVPPV